MSRKSIAACARIATRRTKEGTRVPIGLEVCFTGSVVCMGDETEKTYAADGMVDVISDAAAYGTDLFENEVPIICMYEGMYDLTLSWAKLADRYRLEPIAKSSTEFFSITLRNKDGRANERPAAILFDLRHIMPRGMTAMAEAVDMKRDGTAMQDCRIMRAYVLTMADRHGLYDTERGALLGSTVTTLTSIARHQIDEELGWLTYGRRQHGKIVPRSLKEDYIIDASREAPQNYEQYATRRACMRGGFSFVSARETGTVHGRVVPIDETSAYHAQAICRWVPEGFKVKDPSWLQRAAEQVVRKTTWAVLQAYHMPILTYMYIEVCFTNLRLKPGTVFEAQEIGLEATARLYDAGGVEGIDNASMIAAEAGVRRAGFRDRIEGGAFCFAKVMAADKLTTWVTEQELWCMAQVYAWDTMEVVRGEATCKRKRPDDLAILTSMFFWTEKQTLKDTIESMDDGEERQRLQRIYGGEVKPKFNAVGYGIHARDEYRPNWRIDDDGNWSLEDAITPETFDERKPKRNRAWLNYGIRIAGGARMHLIIAMQLLWDTFGDKARIVAGDTDSLKVATELPEADIIAALRPLHDATRRAIDRTTSRAREMWPDMYDPMIGVGEFVTEGEPCSEFYTAGPKMYLSRYGNGAVELTCAGIPQSGEYSYGAWIKMMVDKYGMDILRRVFTFNVTLSKTVSQITVVDYEPGQLPERRGVEYTLLESTKPENWATIEWQRARGRRPILNSIACAEWRDDGPVFVYTDGEL